MKQPSSPTSIDDSQVKVGNLMILSHLSDAYIAQASCSTPVEQRQSISILIAAACACNATNVEMVNNYAGCCLPVATTVPTKLVQASGILLRLQVFAREYQQSSQGSFNFSERKDLRSSDGILAVFGLRMLRLVCVFQN